MFIILSIFDNKSWRYENTTFENFEMLGWGLIELALKISNINMKSLIFQNDDDD